MTLIWTSIKETYVLCALLSYARRYWRKAEERNTRTAVALQLRALLKPNPRKARDSCRKENKKKTKGRAGPRVSIYDVKRNGS